MKTLFLAFALVLGFGASKRTRSIANKVLAGKDYPTLP